MAESAIWAKVFPSSASGDTGGPGWDVLTAVQSGMEALLTWPAAGGSPAGYEVAVDGQIIDVGDVLTYTHPGMVFGQPYLFKVRAHYASELYGGWSSEKTVTLTYSIASGGSESFIENDGKLFKVHSFIASGSLVVTQSGLPPYYVVVAGGGGGGCNHGGGGGGGGVLSGSATLPLGTLPVTVGTGGAGGVGGGNAGTNGGDSTFNGLTAKGGGGGGGRINSGQTNAGKLGGSGGGGAGTNPVTAGAGTTGQGNAGGVGTSDSTAGNGGGGGGAGQAGAAASGTGAGAGTSGKGGDGLLWDYTGVKYGAGGSGGRWATGAVGAGGLDGGGVGGAADGAVGSAGAANKGAGGGGGGGATANGGAGGSGFIGIAYEIHSIPPVLTVSPGDTVLVLSWTAAQMAGTTIASYEVEQDGVISNVGNVLTVDVTGLTNGQSYAFRVRGVTAEGAFTDWSDVVAAVPAQFNEATGGTVTTITDYNGTGETWRVHTFTTSGTFQVLKAPQPFAALVVAGGSGGGGEYNAGSARSGGIIDGEQTLAVDDHAVVVGAYGPGGKLGGEAATMGSPSSLGALSVPCDGSNAPKTSSITGSAYTYSPGSPGLSGGYPAPGSAWGQQGCSGAPHPTGGDPSASNRGQQGIVVVAYRIG